MHTLIVLQFEQFKIAWEHKRHWFDVRLRAYELFKQEVQTVDELHVEHPVRYVEQVTHLWILFKIKVSFTH